MEKGSSEMRILVNKIRCKHRGDTMNLRIGMTLSGVHAVRWPLTEGMIISSVCGEGGTMTSRT